MPELFFILIAVIALLSAVCTVVACMLFGRFFTRAEYQKYSAKYRYKDYADKDPEKFRRRSVHFYSGKNKLQGYVYGTPKSAKGLIVIAHGIGNGHEYFINEISYFLDKNWCVLAYDATGSCESEGKSTVGLVQSALDCREALRFALADEELCNMNTCLFGHSWGGFAVTGVLNFTQQIKNVKAVASVSGYNSPIYMTMSFARTNIGAFCNLLYPAAWIHYRRLHGRYNTITALKGINKSNIPVKIFHAKNDKLILINSTAIYAQKAKITNPYAEFKMSDSEFMDEHSTLFRNRENAEYVENVQKGYEEIEKSYKERKSEVPELVASSYFAKVDREKYNMINTEMISEIEEFFSSKVTENTGDIR